MLLSHYVCDSLNPPCSSVCGIFQARILELGCHFFLQKVFPIQESNPQLLCLLHWQLYSLPLSHQRSRRGKSYHKLLLSSGAIFRITFWLLLTLFSRLLLVHICEIVPQLCVCVCVCVHVFYNASDYSTTIFFFQDSIAVLGHAMLSRSVVSDSLRLHHVPLCMGILQARILEWVACPPPTDLPNQGIEPWSPAFQADTLPLEPLRGP